MNGHQGPDWRTQPGSAQVLGGLSPKPSGMGLAQTLCPTKNQDGASVGPHAGGWVVNPHPVGPGLSALIYVWEGMCVLFSTTGGNRCSCPERGASQWVRLLPQGKRPPARMAEG